LPGTEGSPRLAIHLLRRWNESPLLEPNPMIKHVARRTGRIALTIGPLAAIALTLAAGLKWH